MSNESAKPKRKIWKYIVYPLIIIVLILVAVVVYVNSREADLHNTILIVPNQFLPDSSTMLNLVIKKGDTDTPIANADVTIELKSKMTGKAYNLGSFKTNPQGVMEDPIAIPDIAEGDYLLAIKTSSSFGSDDIEKSIRIQRTYRLILTTDKPLYQPGQTIHIKSVCLNNFNFKPASDTPIIIEIEDSKSNKIFKKSFSTSGHGIAATDFTLADEINMGEYRVRATVSETTAEKVITISKYNLPKFKVALATDKTYYLPEEVVKGTISADYFFGKPVSSGAVKIELSSFIEEFEVFQTITGNTDRDGVFKFEAKLPDKFFGTPLAKGDAILKVETSVTDTAGQIEKSSQIYPVAQEALKITAIPESGELVPDVENIVYLVTAYPDGKPAIAKVYVSTNTQVAAVETNKFGVGEIKFTPQANVSIQITGVDAQGNTGNVQLSPTKETEEDYHYDYYRKQYGPYNGEGTVYSSEDFLVRPNKGIYRSGDNMFVTILSKEKSGTFYLDIVKDKQTVLTKIIDVRDNIGSLTFGLPLNLSGLITLSAYHILTDGNIMRDTRVVFIEPTSQLNIKMAKDKKTYLPQETAKLNLQVTDANNNPVQSALGFSIVDESIFALAESEPGLLKVYYEIEKEVMRPRYEIEYFSPNLFIPLPDEKESELQQRGSALLSAVEPVALDSNTVISYKKNLSALERKKENFNETVGGVIMGILLILGLISAALVLLLYPILFAVRIKSRVTGIIVVGLWLIIAALIWLSSNPYQFGYHYEVRGSIVTISVVVLIGYCILALISTFAAKGWFSKVVGLLAILIILIILSGIGTPDLLSARYSMAKSALESKMPGLDAFGEYLKENAGQLHIRQYFPETLFWQPELITDKKGQLQVDVPLADSISTWRTMIDGISKDGKLGSAQEGITVFQDFFIDLNLPRTLTQDDEISVPIAVYNYLAQAQDITLTVQEEKWFTPLESITKTIRLAPNEVGSTYFRMRIADFGIKNLLVSAKSSSGFQDAIKKSIEILPNGKEMQFAVTDRVANQVTQQIFIPDNAVDNASSILVKIYPGVFATIADGFERLIRLPYGCFEQTSSITYPNVLLFDYLKTSKQITPETSMKLEQAINLGYQRLINFEVPGGGFSLFGSAPASEFLTAYGVLEFTDMNKVYPIDTALIDRTNEWLMKKQKPNGMWGDNLNQTAYTCWALLESGSNDRRIDKTINFILQQDLEVVGSYQLALCANAMAAYDPNQAFTKLLVQTLEKNATTGADTAFWKSSGETLMHSYGYGPSQDIETTALAAYALIKGKGNTQLINKALNYLVTTRDNEGGWYSTQATIWSIKALLASLTQAMPMDGEINVTIKANREQVAAFRIDKSNYDVVQQFSLDRDMIKNVNLIKIDCDRESNLAYQITAKYYLDWDSAPQKPPEPEALALSVEYDKTELNVNDELRCRVKCAYNSSIPAGMVLIDLGIPPGFAPDTSTFDKLVGQNGIAKYSFTGRQITIYIEDMANGMTLNFSYGLKALYPIKAQTPVSRAYEYYNPEQQSFARPVLLEVK